MNHKKIYRVKTKSKLGVYLLIFICTIQIILLIIEKSSFRVPLTDSQIEKINPILKKIEIGNIYYKRKSLCIDQIKHFDEKNNVSIICRNIVLKFKNFSDLILLSPNKLDIEKVSISSSMDSQTIFLHTVNLDFTEEVLNILLNVNTKSFDIDLRGLVNFNNIQSQPQKSPYDIPNTTKLLKDILSQISSVMDNVLPTDFKQSYISYFELDNNFDLYINQSNKLQSDQLHSNLNLTFSLDLIKEKICTNFLRIDDLNLKFNNQRCRIGTTEIKSLPNNENHLDLSITVHSGKMHGNVMGNLPNFSLFTKNSSKSLNFSIISDTNFTKCSTAGKWTYLNNEVLLDGFVTLIPSYSNLFAFRNGVKYKILDGDSFKLDLSTNQLESLSINHNLKLNAQNFSVLESPPGDFDAFGFVKSNYSIHLDEVFGQMGSSSVSGTFTQEWFPNTYKFVVDGNCLPTDLDNWLGSWWRSIWEDFSFDDLYIPEGNFIVSGIWGDDLNSTTYGHVNCQNVSYRDLFLVNSDLEIISDSNNTEIITPTTKHSSGKFSGKILFPREYDYISYSIDGDYPLNSGKRAFGFKIEEYLNDFNLSNVYVSSHGYIPLPKDNVSLPDQFNPMYVINFNTDQNGSWNGIKFNSAIGEIDSNATKLDLNLEKIKFNQGELSLRLNNNLVNDFINVSSELRDCSLKKTTESILALQENKDISFAENENTFHDQKESLINFSLNASGPANDLMKLNGSGKIQIQSKKLSRIPLLGIISEGLSSIPIPVPTASLSFNNIEGLFELQNEKIYFENLSMTGKISKIESKGYLDIFNKTINLNSKLRLMGNIPIPILDKIASIADPLAYLAEFKISGNWNQPNWELLIKPFN